MDPSSTHVFHRSLQTTPPVAVRGQGIWLEDAAGKRYLDASGGAAVSCLGHGHPDVLAAMHAQRSAKLLKGLCERLRVPTECRETADVVAREHGNIHRSSDLSAAALVRLLERCDAIRKPARFEEILLACECDARGRLGFEETPYPQRQRLAEALLAAQSVATSVIAARAAAAGATGQKIGEWIHAARVEAVAAWPGLQSAPGA